MIFLDDPYGWFSPNIKQLTGGGTFEDFTNGVAGWVLVAALLGLLLAAGAWALGVSTGNIQWAERGKQGAVVAGLVSLLVGGAAVYLDFFNTVGHHLH